MRGFWFLFLLTLSACGVSRPPVFTAPEKTRAEVQNWPGGRSTLGAQLYGDSGSAVVASGTVRDAGVLEFALSPVNAAQLTPFAPCPGVTVSDTALRLGTFSALEPSGGGRIALASSLDVVTSGLQRPGDSYLQYTYADRAARLGGSCKGSFATFIYDLSLQPGWNAVRFEQTAAGDFTLSNNPLPESAGWFFSGVQQ